MGFEGVIGEPVGVVVCSALVEGGGGEDEGGGGGVGFGNLSMLEFPGIVGNPVPLWSASGGAEPEGLGIGWDEEIVFDPFLFFGGRDDGEVASGGIGDFFGIAPREGDAGEEVSAVSEFFKARVVEEVAFPPGGVVDPFLEDEVVASGGADGIVIVVDRVGEGDLGGGFPVLFLDLGDEGQVGFVGFELENDPETKVGVSGFLIEDGTSFRGKITGREIAAANDEVGELVIGGIGAPFTGVAVEVVESVGVGEAADGPDPIVFSAGIGGG